MKVLSSLVVMFVTAHNQTSVYDLPGLGIS